MSASANLREKGNESYSNGSYLEAIKYFNQALSSAKTEDETASAFKNLGHTHLKLNSEKTNLYQAQEAVTNLLSALDYGCAANKSPLWKKKVKENIEIASKALFNTIVNVHSDIKKRTDALYFFINKILNYNHREGIRSHFYLQVAQILFNRAITLQEEGDHRKALQLLQQCNQEIEFAISSASKSVQFNAIFPDGVSLNSIEELKNSSKYENCFAKSYQMLEIGNETFSTIIENEDFSVELVWTCIDNYRQSIIYASEEKILLIEARAVGKIGELYYSLLKNEEMAERYFDKFWELTEILGGPQKFMNEDWWSRATKLRQTLAKIKADRENAEKEKLFQEIKDKCKDAFDELASNLQRGTVVYLKFVWEKYPPVSKDVYSLPDTIPADALKKTLLKCIRYFHPDKHSAKLDTGDEESVKQYVIFSEITKQLNNKYTILKAVD